jgi:ribonuclease P protein component
VLSRKYRLKKNSAFTATYKIKHSYYFDGVAVFVGLKKKNDKDVTHVGFVVSKKTHKRAVKRNRLKRLMRECYRILLKKNELGKSQDYMSLVFVGHEKALNSDFNKMYNIFERLLGKIDD